jgi:hypothetical protein
MMASENRSNLRLRFGRHQAFDCDDVGVDNHVFRLTAVSKDAAHAEEVAASMVVDLCSVGERLCTSMTPMLFNSRWKTSIPTPSDLRRRLAHGASEVVAELKRTTRPSG